MSLTNVVFLCCSLISAVLGQTQVDLGTQSKGIDFTAAAATLPMKAGTSLPASCRPAELFFKIDSTAGSNIYGCTSTNTWTVQSGGGVPTLQPAGLGITWQGAQTLTIGATCAVASPCNVRFGNTTYSIQNGATATVSAGSGLAFVYISSAGVLTVGHNLTVGCTAGCASQSGVSGFPTDSIPLFTWSATSGAWDATGGVDFRAYLGTKNAIGGLGLIATDTAGLTTMSVDPTMVGLRTAAPATATGACTVGNWAFDATHFYLCIAVNSWVRAEVAAW